MLSQLRVSRRKLLPAMALLASTTFDNTPVIAAKRAPDIKGRWVGQAAADEWGVVGFEMDIKSQNKKSGKIKGTASVQGSATVNFSGEIKPNGKISASIKSRFNGQPGTLTFNVKLSEDGQRAQGTFKTIFQNAPRIDGFVEIQRITGT